MVKKKDNGLETNEMPLKVQKVAQQTSQEIKDSFNDMMNQIEQNQKENQANNFRKEVDNIIDKADEKLKDFSNNSTVQEYWRSIKKNYDAITDNIVEVACATYERAMKNEDISHSVDYLKAKFKDISLVANDKYQQFIHNPQVRKSVVTAVNVVSDLVEKSKKGITDSLNSINKVNE